MWNWLERLFGKADRSAPADIEYDPVYGLPKRAVEQWLEHNPQLRQEYEIKGWLARNPPLHAEQEAAKRQRSARLPSPALREREDDQQET